MTSLGRQDTGAATALPARLETAAIALLGLSLPLAVMSYRSLPLTIGLAAALLVGSAATGHGRPWRIDPIFAAAAALFFALAAVTLVWTPEPREAAEVLVFHTGIAVALGTVLAGRQIGGAGRAVSGIMVLGLALAAILLILEMQTGLVLHRLVRANLNPSKMNQSAVAAAVWLWPVLLIARARWGRGAAGGLGVLVAIAILGSESETAKLALVMGSVAFALFQVRQRWLVLMLALAVVCFVMLQPLLPALLDAVLPASALDALRQGHARERLVIWRSFAAAVALKPVFGLGFDSSGTIGFGPFLAQFPEALRAGIRDSHPHNMALQVWVETGIAGAVLVSFALGRATLGIIRQEGATRAAAAASIVSALLVAAVGYGAWQAWWVATLAILPVLLTLASPAPEPGPDEDVGL